MIADDDDEEDTLVRVVPPNPEGNSPAASEETEASDRAGRGVNRRTFLARTGMVAVGGALTLLPAASRILPKEEAVPPAPGKLAGGKSTIVQTACPVCPMGCTLEATLADGRWISIAGSKDSPINSGRLCSRATAAHTSAVRDGRLTEPLKRDGAGWRKLDWPTAIREIAAKLRKVRADGGPDAVYWMGSGNFTNEQAYLFRKLTALWGTNNLDHQGRNDREGVEAGLANLWGMGGATNGFNDLRHSKLILAIGADPAARNPVAMEHIAAARRDGAPLVVFDALRTQTGDVADRFHALRPGSDVALAWGLFWHIRRKAKLDSTYYLRRVHGTAAVRTEVARWSPAEVERVSGLKPAEVEAIADLMIARRPAALLWARSGTREANSANVVRAFATLQLALGNIGVSGGGLIPISEDGNAQGASDMGLLCNSLPGYYGLEEKSWKHWARAWDLDFNFVIRRFASEDAMWRPGVTGARWPEAILAEEKDLTQRAPIRAAMLFGHDVARQTDLPRIGKALESAELVVIANHEPTIAAALPERQDGMYLLPAAGPFEDRGTVTLTGRAQQWREAVRPPPGGARRYDAIMSLLADALGLADPFLKNIRVVDGAPNLDDVSAEMRRGLISLGYTGASPDRIRAQMRRASDFDEATSRAASGPHKGEYYGLPYPCWGKPDMPMASGGAGAARTGHPGTPILFDVAKPIEDGGHCFWGRFGAERDGRTILADVKGPKTSHFPLGYVEFFMIHLINLGWSKELSDTERRTIEQIEGNSTSWRFDISGGILRVALNHGCSPSGNGKARAVVWNFPDPVPVHREPVLTLRRDLVDQKLAGNRRIYPAARDARRYRLPQPSRSLQRRDLSSLLPLWLIFQPVDPPTPTAPAMRFFHVMINPADARKLELKGGAGIRVFGPVGETPLVARAVITDRVPAGVAAVPVGFSGMWRGRDIRGRYPRGLAPERFGEPAYLLAGPEYSFVSGGEEGRLSLCRIEPMDGSPAR